MRFVVDQARTRGRTVGICADDVETAHRWAAAGVQFIVLVCGDLTSETRSLNRGLMQWQLLSCSRGWE